MGDLNSHSAMWGSRVDDLRGRILVDWISDLGLCCLSTGGASTCVRPQGESVVDVAFASPSIAATLVSYWVLGLETLSDHLYVHLGFGETGYQATRRSHPRPARWALRSFDRDRMEAAIIAGTWVPAPPAETWDVEKAAICSRNIVRDACDVAMARARPRFRRAMPWWTPELAELRRRRVGPTCSASQGGAKATLRRAIAKAKERSWADFTATLSEEPWGRPYLVVMNRLRRWSAPVTETLEPGALEGVLNALFPVETEPRSWDEEELPETGWKTWQPEYEVTCEELIGAKRRMMLRNAAPGPNGIPIFPVETEPCSWDEEELPETGWKAWQPEYEVTCEELIGAKRRMMSRNAAPGPNGIPYRAWGVAVDLMGGRMRALFTECLRRGVFPAAWKRAALVLLRKPGKPADAATGYRPICMIDDEAKLFER
ncbi:PREDICTED: uncharacterized protein LOC108763377, partial [Trachymyrmex cornetzi]|uniref:uncharacterized protein LOC108763377 n=1 Tax=Trachymyrmex cornetzi TaxID=471704 RepID=UPI00084EE1FB